jgi:hypothetical protein
MKKYKIGSGVLHLENCKDTDYVILSNEYGDYKMIYDKTTGEDLIYITSEYLTFLLTYQKKNKQLLMYNYQYDRDIIGQEFPIEYHILDYRQELIKYLKDVVRRKLFNFNKQITLNKLYCSKRIYHIAYNIFILQNNSPILTKEQKAIVQQIHDGLMPIGYLDTLEHILYNIKEV